MDFQKSLSLEESNKNRIKLGLKPLLHNDKDSETPEFVILNDDQQAEQNFKRVREEQAKFAQEKALTARIEKVREKFKLLEKLSGRTLGEAIQAGGEDLKSWIKKDEGAGVCLGHETGTRNRDSRLRISSE